MSKTEHTGGRVLLALGVLLAALFVLSFCLGRYGVDAGTTCRILLSPLLPLEPTWTDHEYTAVMNIRLPRIVLACNPKSLFNITHTATFFLLRT